METARKTFEINNGVKVSLKEPWQHHGKLIVQEIDPVDSLYLYSKEEEKVLADQEPWATEYAPADTLDKISADDSPTYFHTVKISAVALVKMVCFTHPMTLTTGHSRSLRR